jgi:hypothetical protein
VAWVEGEWQRPVMYFELELDAEEQRRRVRDLAAGLGKPIPENLCYLSALGMPTRKAFTLARESCKRYGVRLLIVDSLGPAMLGEAEKAWDVIGFHNYYIAPFREAGVTVVIIDHQGKLQAGESYQQKTSFGSVYKELLVRSVIQVEARDRNREAGTVTITLQPKKASFGALRNPFAARLTFKEEKITAEAVELDETELATEGTLNADDRVKLALRCGPAYLETGRGFFEGVCGRQNPQLTFRDPPPPLHNSPIVRDSVYFQRLRSRPGQRARSDASRRWGRGCTSAT